MGSKDQHKTGFKSTPNTTIKYCGTCRDMLESHKSHKSFCVNLYDQDHERNKKKHPIKSSLVKSVKKLTSFGGFGIKSFIKRGENSYGVKFNNSSQASQL